MGLQIFKPTKNVTGCALGISFNSKDSAIYWELIKQTGWDDAKRLGSFKEGMKANVKFSLIEAAALIDVIETTLAASVKSDKAQLNAIPRPFSGYHSNPTGSTRIALVPYLDKETKELKGLSLSVTKVTTGENPQELKFGLGLTPAESVLIREYLKYALSHAFDAIYSADRKRSEEYKKTKEEAVVPETKKAAGADEPEDPFS